MEGFVLSDELRVSLRFLTSLAIGLLLGLQRERTPSAKAGLRTFALVALFGSRSGADGARNARGTLQGAASKWRRAPADVVLSGI